MRRSYKYRAYINKETEANANNWLDVCRSVYNKGLEQRIKNYEERKEKPEKKIKSISFYDQYALIKKKDHPEYKDVYSHALEHTLKDLDEAYKHFFRRVREKKGKPGFPRFASRDRFCSFRLRQTGWKLDDKNLSISKVGRFKLKLHRPIEGKIKTVTVKREVDKWYVIFSCENVPQKILPSTGKNIGIDVGLSSFVTDSDGNKINHPKFFTQTQRELRVKQRKLSRCKRSSNRRKKVKKQVAKLHQKTANKRKDFVYNIAADYVRKYDTIAVEDLTIKNMVKNKYLAKNIHDASWNLFISHMEHKAEETGKQLIKVDAKDTSQLCSRCGNMVHKGLNVRIHKCKKCGLIIDRDLNAAINILGRAVPSDVKFSGYTDLSEKHNLIPCR